MDRKDSSSDLEKSSVSLQLESSATSQRHLRTLADIDPVVEAKLRRKIDRRILPVVAAIYLCCYLDRSNIGNAKLAHLERDLNMKGFDYNILLTAFYASYMVFELPCQMLTKWLGPGKTLPMFGFLFGLFTFAMAFVKSFGAGIAVRFFLGIAESAVFPGISYFLSRYYRKDELGFRLACYLVCTAAAGALGGLLASGILRISHIGWLTEWRLIFFIEGLASMVIAAASWFLLADRPSACKWLTPEERELAEFRVMAENVGQHEAIDKMRSKAVKAGIWNANTLAIVRGHWSKDAIEALCLMKSEGWSLREEPKTIEAEVRRRVPAMHHEEGLSYRYNALTGTMAKWKDKIHPNIYKAYQTAGKKNIKKSGEAVAVHPHTEAYRGYVSDASKTAKVEGKSGTITSYCEGWRESELNPLVTEGKYYESGRKRKRVDEQTAQAQREYDSAYNQRRQKRKKENKNVVESALDEEALNTKV